MRIKQAISNKEFYLTGALLYFGAVGCFSLTHYAGTPGPASSALITLVPWPLEKRLSAINLAVIFCGSFIGMGENLSIVLIAPIIAAILSVFLKDKFTGLGGKLGAIAFVSSLVTLFLINGVMWIF
tara:strand:+ start:1354 stop:1731 length:378 start_codon:yes stop_codon:yes gene_type:complete